MVQIRDENDLRPEDIQKIKAILWPMAKFPFSAENRLTTAEDRYWNIPYQFALLMNRVGHTHWHEPGMKENPKIQEFMQRVEWDLSTDEEEFSRAKLEEPAAAPVRLEVVAKGKTFKVERRYAHGARYPEEFRMTDEELIEKFRENASTVLPLDNTNKVVQTVFELEKLENAAELMELVAP